MSPTDCRRPRLVICAAVLVLTAGYAAVAGRAQDPAKPAQTTPVQQTPAQPAATAPRVSSVFALDVESAAGAGSVSLTRPDGGIAALNLLYTGAAAVAAQVKTTPFVSDSGSAIAVEILSNCADGSSKQVQPVAINASPNSI